MVGCVPGSLSRKGSRNRIPPVAPGLEPEEQAERDREERAASLARSAAARAAWVYEVRWCRAGLVLDWLSTASDRVGEMSYWVS